MPIVKSGTIRTTVNCSLAYILNPDKTEDLLYTSSLNCMMNARDAYLNMKMVYEQFPGRSFDEPIPEKGKARVKAIHYIQSFSPDENITPEQTHRIAKAFVLKTFGEDCQAAIATHVDKNHIHSHIILNTYSITGQKFNDNMTTRNRVREYSDRVCLAFGIQPLQKKETTKGSTYGEWNHKRKGTSWKEKIRIEIDSLIGSVKNLDELLAALEERGYTLKKGKHISVKAPGQQRAVRLENLGEAYALESLDIRICYSEVGSDIAYPDEQSELRNAYEYVLGKVTRLAEQEEKVQRKRNVTDLHHIPLKMIWIYIACQPSLLSLTVTGCIPLVRLRARSLHLRLNMKKSDKRLTG